MNDDEQVAVHIHAGEWFRLHLDGDGLFLIGLAILILAGAVVFAVCGTANHVFDQSLPVVSPTP